MTKPLTLIAVAFLLACSDDSKKKTAPDAACVEPPCADEEQPNDTACEPSSGAQDGADVTLARFIPGTSSLLAFGETDAAETGNAYTYDVTTGTVTVRMAGLPIGESVTGLFAYDKGPLGMDPAGKFAVVRARAHDVRHYSLYVLDLAGSAAPRILGAPATRIEDAAPSDDARRLLAWSSDGGSLANQLDLIDVASGDVTSLYTGAAGTAVYAEPVYDTRPRLSPDGNHVIFALRLASRIYELYAVASTGAGLVKLSPPLGPNETVSPGDNSNHCGYRFSADGGRVVFTLANGTTGSTRLYAVDVDGGNLTPLTPALEGDSTFVPYACPQVGDGRVVYALDTPDGTELHVVSLDGGNDQRLDTDHIDAFFASQRGVWPTPDGSRVLAKTATGVTAFALDGTTVTPLADNFLDYDPGIGSERLVYASDDDHVWSVRYDGTDRRDLTPPSISTAVMSSPGYVRGWRFTSDGQWVIARSTVGTYPNSVDKLWALRTDGSNARDVTPTDMASDNGIQDFVLEPTTGAFALTTTTPLSGDLYLFGGTIDGGSGGAHRCVFDAYDVTPATQSPSGDVVLGSEQQRWYRDARGLVVMRYDGTAYQRAFVPAPTGDSFFVVDSSGNAVISKSSAWVAFSEYTPEVKALHTVRLADQAHYVVPVPEGRDSVGRPVLSDDDAHVAFLARVGSSKELWVANIDGTNPHRVSNDDQQLESINEAAYRFTPDNQALVFLAAPATPVPPCGSRTALYIVGVDGNDNRQLSAPDAECAGVSAAGSGAYQFEVRFTPDNAHVLYVASGDTDADYALYVASLDGSTHARLTPSGGPASAVGFDISRRCFEIAPDGTHVVYATGTGYAKPLWTIPLAGGTPAHLIDDVYNATYFYDTPATTIVASIAGASSTYGLAAARLDGSSAAVISTPAAYTGGPPRVLGVAFAEAILLTGDGMLAARLDGSGTRTVASLSRKREWPAALSADRTEILYVHDGRVPNVPELFALRLADGTTTHIGPNLELGGGVTSIITGPNGAVLISADAETHGKQDLVEVR